MYIEKCGGSRSLSTGWAGYYEDWMYGDHVKWAEEDADIFELQ
jgi:hypothetical protein